MRCCNKLSLNDLVAGLFYVSMIFFLTTKTTSANPIHTNGWRTNLEKFRLMDMGDGETFIYVTPENGIMIAKKGTNSQKGSVFRLCDGENLCPESSDDCEFKAKLCVVNDDDHKLSEIRFDTVHGIVARQDSDLSVNDRLSPPVHALLAGTDGVKTSDKYGEFIKLEESGRQALSEKTIHAHFDEIENEKSYRQFKWYDQSDENRREGRFKICRIGGSC